LGFNHLQKKKIHFHRKIFIDFNAKTRLWKKHNPLKKNKIEVCKISKIKRGLKDVVFKAKMTKHVD
jgi:hypothetical protein